MGYCRTESEKDVSVHRQPTNANDPRQASMGGAARDQGGGTGAGLPSLRVGDRLKATLRKPYNLRSGWEALPELVEKAKPPKGGDAKLEGLRLRISARTASCRSEIGEPKLGSFAARGRLAQPLSTGRVLLPGGL